MLLLHLILVFAIISPFVQTWLLILQAAFSSCSVQFTDSLDNKSLTLLKTVQEKPSFSEKASRCVTSIKDSFTTLGNEAELKIPYVPLTLPIHYNKWLKSLWLRNKTCFMFLLLSEAVYKALCHLEYPLAVLHKRITKFIWKRQRSLRLVFLSFS